MAVLSLCVFCGSSEGSPEDREAAATLGRLVGERAGRIVYGGASCGVMGVVADAALEAGAKVHGVLPDFMGAAELAHAGLTELERVPSMHERKIRMIELASAFAVLPGGFGTLDELFEVLTLAQLGGHAKPVGILDTGGYYSGLRSWMEGAVERGYLRPDHLGLMAWAATPAALLEAVDSHDMPEMPSLLVPRDL